MIDVQKNNEPLDLSYLREMAGDSTEFIIEMIDMFKLQTPLYVADLEKAVAERDWLKVSATAHKIKPTFTYVGREDARLYMQKIEHDAREGNNPEELAIACMEVVSFIEVLDKQLDEAKAELQRQL